MNIQQLKTHVKEAFANVDSAEYLQLQIEKGIEKHRREFRQQQMQNPGITFEEWKAEIESSVNPNAQQDHMAIGIYLLALDECNHENI